MHHGWRWHKRRVMVPVDGMRWIPIEDVKFKEDTVPNFSKSVFMDVLNFEIVHAESTIEKFKEDLENNPAEAFAWGGDAVRAAARLRVYKNAKKQMEPTADEGDAEPQPNFGLAFNALCSVVLYNLISDARDPHTSTSAMQNVVKSEVTAAWAHLADRMGLAPRSRS